MSKILVYIHNIGLLLILVCAFIILVLLQSTFLINTLFSLGVLMITAGRFWGPLSDYSLSQDYRLSLTVRRLYRQRIIAVCLLYLSILFLFIPEGFYWGYYLRRSFWFIPLLVFTIIEIYTIFRLSSIENKEDINSNNKSHIIK